MISFRVVPNAVAFAGSFLSLYFWSRYVLPESRILAIVVIAAHGAMFASYLEGITDHFFAASGSRIVFIARIAKGGLASAN